MKWWSLVEDVRNFVTDPENRGAIEQMKQILVDSGLRVEPPPIKPKRKSRAKSPEARLNLW